MNGVSMKRGSLFLLGWIVVAGIMVACVLGLPTAGSAAAAPGVAAPVAPPHAPTAADLTRVEAELARVQQELREQRALILQVMEMHSALLRYMQGGSASAAGTSLPPPPGPGGPVGGGAPAGAADAAGEPALDRGPAPASTGTISGLVRPKSGALGDAYVYVDGPKVIAPRGRTIEIKQHSKQFSPSVAVIQTGTRVLFPNEDKIFHNVFSPTPGAAFDLGTLKSGDRPNPIAMTKPGHVEIFCNIHSSMRADVLVVPNAHWTRVRPDGTFQIAGVPFGQRQLVLWGPGLKPASVKVELNATGAVANFSPEPAPPRRHLNKAGGEYGSYED